MRRPACRGTMAAAAVLLAALAVRADGGPGDGPGHGPGNDPGDGVGTEAGEAGFAARLAAADAARGEQVFLQCRGCHQAAAGGAHMVGPNLYGVIGREAGSAAGFGFYSKAMQNAGISWSPAQLDAYLADPRAVVAGTSMAFGGLKNGGDRADLIAYLKGLE